MAPSSKRQRCSSTASATSNDNAKDDVAAAAPASAVPSLQNFALLPNELRTRIVKLACRLPSSSSSTLDADKPSTTSSSATPGLDTTTALSLVRVSRSLYAVITPLIWSHVWITTASALASFHQAIAARPQLGRLVTNLHLGPDDQLPKWWYPFALWEDSSGSTFTTISHSLRGAHDARLLPRWCNVEDDWILGDIPADDCREVAIHHALIVLQEGLDIDLTTPRRGLSRAEINAEEWVTRSYEVQAGLELYLMGMRRLDDEHERKNSSVQRSCGSHPEQCLSYPPLLLTGTSSGGDTAAKSLVEVGQAITFSRYELLRHLARPGCITDRLDHPLLFERSGLEMTERLDDYGSRRWEHEGGEDEEQEDLADLWSPSHAKGKHGAISPALPDVLDPALPNSATLGSLLALARGILCFTPLLQNLCLTGFLDRSLCGFKTLSLKRLRYLTIGPPPPAWFAPLRFASAEHLKSLRIAGVELSEDEAVSLNCELSDLTRLQWSLATEWSNEPTDRDDDDLDRNWVHLDKIVGYLTGKDGPLAPRSGGTGLDEGYPGPTERPDNSDGGEIDSDIERFGARGTSADSSLPLYEIKLHPSDLEALLDKAPSAEARAAWLTGTTVDRRDRCRLLLVKSAAAAKGEWKGVSCTSSEELYKEGREWWERYAGL